MKKIGKLTLHAAATQRNIPVLIAFLESGTAVDERDQFGLTALYYAAYGGGTEAITFLLDRGADVNSQGKSGQTPLSIAAYHGHDEVVQFLLARGAQVDLANERGVTPLTVSLGNTFNPSTLRLLVEGGANLQLTDQSGNTPLHTAARGNNVAAAEILLQHGADVSALNAEGKSALDVAIDSGHAKFAEFLQAYLPSDQSTRIYIASRSAVDSGKFRPSNLSEEFRPLEAFMDNYLDLSSGYPSLDKWQALQQSIPRYGNAEHVSIVAQQMFIGEYVDVPPEVGVQILRRLVELAPTDRKKAHARAYLAHWLIRMDREYQPTPEGYELRDQIEDAGFREAPWEFDW